jgi:CDP-diacylglycerol--glycerol-3-phosphate 3-phosphatidyltransferase
MKFSHQHKLFLINSVTASRVLSVFAIFFLDNGYLLIISLYAAASDFLDGFLARRYSLTTRFGEQLDQISDKVFHFAFFYYLLRTGGVQIYFVCFFLIREVAIVLLRHLEVVSKSSNLPGKIKTFLTYALIIWILAMRAFDKNFSSDLLTDSIQILILLISYSSLILSLKRKPI